MNRSELKKWVRERVKGHFWELYIPIIITDFLTNLVIGQKIVVENGNYSTQGGVSVGIFFFFVQVGLTSYIINFMNEKEYHFSDLFSYFNDYIRVFLVGLLKTIFTVLWTLLFIIPGIIKGIAYSLVPMLLADEKYKDLKYTEYIKKSQEMMKGHKLDYFILDISYDLWFIIPILIGLVATLFTIAAAIGTDIYTKAGSIFAAFASVGLIWLVAIIVIVVASFIIVPRKKLALTKFLYDIKTNYEGPQSSTTNEEKADSFTTTTTSEAKFCGNCGSQLEKDSTFCANCGTKVE